MIMRPILRPIPCLRAVARITASLVGNTVPTRSRARLYVGQPYMDRSPYRCLRPPPPLSAALLKVVHRDLGSSHSG
jgi:hypothetical protein